MRDGDAIVLLASSGVQTNGLSLCRALADRLAFPGYCSVANREPAGQQRANEAADQGAQRHEGEEHQHAAIAFKTRGFKDFDPGKTGADAERSTAQHAQHQTQ